MLVTAAAERQRDHSNGPKGQSDPSIVRIRSHQKLDQLWSLVTERREVLKETAFPPLESRKQKGKYREERNHRIAELIAGTLRDHLPVFLHEGTVGIGGGSS